jgi:hypothetical protein
MIVLSTQTPVPELHVVLPITVIPFVIVKVLDHATVPAGIITVSPSTAELIARSTSRSEGLEAVIVLAISLTDESAIKNTSSVNFLTFIKPDDLSLIAHSRLRRRIAPAAKRPCLAIFYLRARRLPCADSHK